MSRRIIAYIVLAYGLAWLWWLPMALNGVIVGPGQGWPTHLPGLMAPAIAAILVTGFTDGRQGLRELATRVVRWRVRWFWYALIVATALLALLPVFLGTAGPAASLAYSGAPQTGLLVVVYVLIVNGFGEEIGWRGYLAENLLKRWSTGVTAIIVWAVWGLWHLPLFWVVGNFRDFGVGGTIGWAVGIGFGSVFLTWLYRSAEHSILIVALWHVAYNFSTATEASAGLSAAIASTLVMAASVIILVMRPTWRGPQLVAASTSKDEKRLL